jgi:hypothetical protein
LPRFDRGSEFNFAKRRALEVRLLEDRRKRRFRREDVGAGLEAAIDFAREGDALAISESALALKKRIIKIKITHFSIAMPAVAESNFRCAMFRSSNFIESTVW